VAASGAAPPGGGVQGAAEWAAKLIIFTDNMVLCLVNWPDDGRLAETCRNKIRYINIVLCDGNQQQVLCSVRTVNTLNEKEADFLRSNVF
jgi:hypothetical protein